MARTRHPALEIGAASEEAFEIVTRAGLGADIDVREKLAPILKHRS